MTLAAVREIGARLNIGHHLERGAITTLCRARGRARAFRQPAGSGN
jgi:hypothetical protein